MLLQSFRKESYHGRQRKTGLLERKDGKWSQMHYRSQMHIEKEGMCCWDCKNKVNVLFTWIGGQIAPPNCNDFKRSEQENNVQTEPITVPETQWTLSRQLLVMVSLNCQLDTTQSHLGLSEGFLRSGWSVEDYLNCFNGCGKAQPENEWYPSLAWDLKCGRVEKAS